MPTAAKIRRIRWAKLRVSAMILAGLAIIFVVVYLLTAGSLFRSSSALRIVMNDSQGLVEGALVRFNGVRVGRVGGVRLVAPGDPKRVIELEVEIEDRFLAQMPEDSVAAVSADNLLAEKIIAIRGGRSSNPLEAGDEIRYDPPADVDDQANMLRSLQTTMEGIDKVFSEVEAGRGSLGSLVRGEAIYEEVNTQLLGFQRSLRNISRSASGPGRLILTDEAYKRIEQPLERLDARLAETAQHPLLADSAVYEDVRKRIAEVRRSVADVSANPFFASGETYRRLTSTVSSALRRVDSLNSGEGGFGQLLASPRLYESLSGASLEYAKFLREFREDPRKFLRVNLNLF
jgi:phospholipid/cholesterol/gamma-HCH transport system substrate-binding protein